MTEQRTFVLDKLVRDGIVSGLQDQGGAVEYKILDGPEKIRALVEKLIEEAGELLANGGLPLSELVDVLEVANQLKRESGFSNEEIEEKRQARLDKVGGFVGGWFVRTVSLPSDGELTEYFGSPPERFTEIEAPHG
jgi:predicted house-cleaning noncanonical NTP pyrophosphatase (MazG superfamily)